jgi:hypothetical protein
MPSERVYVVITGECLRAIDQSALPDQFGGKSVFDRNRNLIEGAASAKYHDEGVNERLDGRSVLILLTDNIPVL